MIGQSRGRLRGRSRGSLTRGGSRSRCRFFLMRKSDNLVVCAPPIEVVRIHVLAPVTGLLLTVNAPDPDDVATVAQRGGLGDRGRLGARLVEIQIGFTDELCASGDRVRLGGGLFLGVVRLAVNRGICHGGVDDEPRISAIGRVRGDGHIVLEFITINAVLDSVCLNG